MSYQGKRISNWFKTVSLDILILKKNPAIFKASKLPRWGDQSYPKVATEVTNTKDINIKIFCFLFFIHTFTHVFHPKKMIQKWQFIYLWQLFTLGVTLISQSKLYAPSAIKVTPSVIKVTIWSGNFNWSLIQNIFKKIHCHLWKSYRT